MRNYLFIFCLLAFMFACSDEENGGIEKDPFLPVTGLEIPVKEFVETEIMFKGQGFASDCEIWLQRNGGEAEKVEVVSVTDAGVVIKIPALEAGFYVVVLKQEGKEFRIGGINLNVRDLAERDIEAYGVFGEVGAEIRPLSVSKKVVGQPIFKTKNGYDFGGIVATSDKIYYSVYTLEWVSEPGKPTVTLLKYDLGVYDFSTKENKEIALARQYEYFAMGIIDDKLHVVLTSDYKLFHLVKLEDDGTETAVMDFDLTALAGRRIIEYDNVFEFDEASRTILLSGQSLAGADLDQYAWALNMNTGEVKANGGNSLIHGYTVNCGGIFYCFASEGDDEVNTQVLKLNDPQDWTYNDASLKVASLPKTSFDSPVYSSVSQLIYGMGEDETILIFDPATNSLGKKWVKSGMLRIVTVK